MKSFKQLALAAAVLSASFMAQAEMKSMDDASMSSVTGQAGISIAGTFQGSIGAVTYTDTDATGGTLSLENISLPTLTIAEDAPMTVDVVTSTNATIAGTKQLQIGLPAITGNVSIGAIKIGTNSIGSVGISGINMAGSTMLVWGH